MRSPYIMKPVKVSSKGFTIVELIVVIVVIGILAAVSIVGYGAWQQSIAQTAVESDLLGAVSSMENARTFDNQYPADVNTVFESSNAVTLTGGATEGGGGFCFTAVHQDFAGQIFYISQDTVNDGPQTGSCPIVINWSAVASGSNHSCAVYDDQAFCWGFNSNGQLGNNSTAQSSVPVAVDTSGVLAGRTVTAISAGNGHSCAVADGQVFCWGFNSNGQLGNNSTAQSSVPVAVDTSGVLAGRTVTAISAGNGYSCAVADGQAFCWGRGSSGRLGNNSTAQSSVPVAVDTSGVLAGRTVTAISVGSSHSCAVADDQAFCWGFNGSGHLGNNSTAQSSVPVAVDTSGVLAGRTVTAISVGSSHSCAVADGQAFCWGRGSSGRLGNNSTAQSSVPVAVDTSGVLAGRTVTAISVGSSNVCAIAGGQAFCWGDGWSGQMGNNSTASSLVPVAVDTSGVLAGRTVSAISVGSSNVCAIAGGQAFCWGSTLDLLGNNSTVHSIVPAAVDTSGVLAGRTVSAISLVSSHSCAIADGQAFCWGLNASGRLGNNSTAQSSVPVAVNTSGVLAGRTVTAISAGNGHSCAVADGQAFCWGSGSSGQLGNNSTAQSSVPVAVNTSGVLAGRTVTAISVGTSHSCAVADGQAFCWGAGGNGILGNNSTAQSIVPVAVNTSGVLAGRTITAISAGLNSSCAVADGQAFCWGSGNSGQLGNNSTTNSSVPVAVDTIGVLAGRTSTAISGGGNANCAVADGQAFCWGFNGNGQLGNNSTTNSSVPVAVSTSGVLAGRTASAISVGNNHSCAVADDQAFCWGSNVRGELGNNSFANSLVPVAVTTSGVLAGRTVTAISAGLSVSCAVAGGQAFCWGSNSGPLGINTTTMSLIPVTVTNP